MSIHLVKLCVGIESVDHLKQSIQSRFKQEKLKSANAQLFHTTRMIPKKGPELINDGSLYWVIKGHIQARQKILDIQPFQDNEGIKRCNIIVDKKLVLTQWHPRSAFQGWRYLYGEDAPQDMSDNILEANLPIQMRKDLMELRLI
ncbi:MAG: DUF1489 domain-containing protein [Pseudomonadota bacterium]